MHASWRGACSSPFMHARWCCAVVVEEVLFNNLVECRVGLASALISCPAALAHQLVMLWYDACTCGDAIWPCMVWFWHFKTVTYGSLAGLLLPALPLWYVMSVCWLYRDPSLNLLIWFSCFLQALHDAQHLLNAMQKGFQEDAIDLIIDQLWPKIAVPALSKCCKKP